MKTFWTFLYSCGISIKTDECLLSSHLLSPYWWRLWGWYYKQPFKNNLLIDPWMESKPVANVMSQKFRVKFKFLLAEFLWTLMDFFLHYFRWTYVYSQVLMKQSLWRWAEFTPREKKGEKFQLKLWEIPPRGILLSTFDTWNWPQEGKSLSDPFRDSKYVYCEIIPINLN